VFIPTDYIGRENSWDYSSVFQADRHLSEPEIRRLADLGAVIGSHGHRHCDLTALNPRALEAELRESRLRLEDIVGGRIAHVSYPFGRVNRRVLNAAEQVGYRVGFTMKYPTANDPPMATGRMAVYGYDTTLAALQKVGAGPLFALESLKADITNRLSSGSELWRRLRKKSR
jgi:peptidoglycan/xylan/chitin deacetylase (PgdA/CDA1 family)